MEKPKRGRPRKPEAEKKSLKNRSEAQKASFEKAPRLVRQEKISIQKQAREEQLAKIYMESKQTKPIAQSPQVRQHMPVYGQLSVIRI
jgi:hypothetical protein